MIVAVARSRRIGRGEQGQRPRGVLALHADLPVQPLQGSGEPVERSPGRRPVARDRVPRGRGKVQAGREPAEEDP